jgi:hypothetical protein
MRKRNRSDRRGQPTFDTPDLLSWLARRIGAEEKAGYSTGHRSLLKHALVADRAVLSKQFARLAEDMRIEDMGVTITSFSRSGFRPGYTWWEWHAGIEGRLPPASGELLSDRTGMLIETSKDGQRGTMHIVVGANIDGHTFAHVLPLACNFDWREDYEPPASILPAATVADPRARLASVKAPTLAEREVQPAAVAALSRRFGVVESSYVVDDNAQHRNGGSRRWFEQSPEIVQAMTKDTMQEATFMLMASILFRTAPIVVTDIPRGTRLPPAAWENRAMFDYMVFDLTDSQAPAIPNGMRGFAP